MAIVHMIENSAELFTDGAYCPIQWIGTEWQDGYSNKQGSMLYYDGQPRSTPSALVLYKSHHGLCISEREANGRDDSDFFMTVWDAEAQAPFEVCFATTRGWTYPCYGSNVDATDEVRAAYETWRDRKLAEALAFDNEAKARKVIDGLNSPHKGALVVVRRGRKATGCSGLVIGTQSKPKPQYGWRYRNGVPEEELFLMIDTGRGFEHVAARHCDVLQPDPSYVQQVFDLADCHHGGSAAAKWHYAYGHAC